MFNRKTKKGQMEILGLAIVIILVTLGMLFMIKFVILKKPTDIRKSYTRTEVASNMINTLLKTNTECRDKDITELIKSCATRTEIDCGGNFSCQYVNNTIEDIFEQTLVKWNYHYQFVVSLPDGEMITHLLWPEGACQGEKETKPYFIPIGLSTINLRLEICN